MREDDISDVLESIGLNKNEVIVYLDLIRVGKSSVTGDMKRTIPVGFKMIWLIFKHRFNIVKKDDKYGKK